MNTFIKTTQSHESKTVVESGRMHDPVFMLLDTARRFLAQLGTVFRAFLLRVLPLRWQGACSRVDYYTIVSPVTMVRVGWHIQSQRMHLLVHGKIDPPHPGIKVQVTFQGHQLDLDAVDNVQVAPLITQTDQVGEFVVDESFFCGPHVTFLTSVTSLPDRETPPVITSLHLEQKDKDRSCTTHRVQERKRPLPTATITIDFESHCQSSVTYWFENPYKKGTISRTTEISYCPTESSALYLKLCPRKKEHASIIDIFTTTEEHAVPRYQRVHSPKNNDEFTRIAIFDPEFTLKSVLILV